MTRIRKVLLLSLLIIPILQYNSAIAATHEFGFGTSLITENNDLRRGFGFNAYYDFSPVNFLAFRSTFGGDFSDKYKSKYGYWDSYYLSRAELATGKTIYEGSYVILAFEEAILVRITKGKFEPYAGFGFGLYVAKHDTNLPGAKSYPSPGIDIYDGSGGDIESVKGNSLGTNIRGGIRYSILPKLLTYIEAKYIYADIKTNAMITVNELQLPSSYRKAENISLNRMAVQVGLSFRL